MLIPILIVAVTAGLAATDSAVDSLFNRVLAGQVDTARFQQHP